MKKSLAQYSHKIAQKHLVMGAMGNISLRDPDRREVAWIKQSGAWLGRAKAGDFIRVDIKTGRPEKGRKPSEEINLHLGCLRARPDINAVIHTHPAMITAIATVLAGKKRLLRHSAPRNDRRSNRYDKGVAIIKYYQPGSKALAQAVKKAIKKANAVAMANHGLVVVGKSLKEAYQRTIAIESGAGKLISRNLK